MAVDDGEIVVIVLLRDKAAGVLAERAHLVLKRRGIADELRLIEHAVDRLHDLIAHLDAHADIDRAGLVLHAVLEADLFQPVRAAAAGGDDGVPGLDGIVLMRIVCHDAAAAPVTHDDVLARAAEEHLHAVLAQVVFNAEIHLVCLFRTEVTDRAVDQTQARADGTCADLLDLFRVLQPLDVLVRAEFEIDAVGIINEFLCLLLADKRRQVTADIAAQRELPVRKCARAGESGRDVAVRLAVHALAGLGFRAAAVFNGLSLLDHDDLLRSAAAQQLQRRENTGRTGADDNNICVHEGFLLNLIRSVFVIRPLISTRCRRSKAQQKHRTSCGVFAVCGSQSGAGNEIRTRYLHLGKVALCQMSYARIS